MNANSTTITTYFNVTEEQVNFCTRIQQDGKVFYYVASQTTIGTDYKVEFNHQHKVLQCNCPAGSRGNNCWHKRAALAASKIYQAERKAEREAQAQAEAEAAKTPEETREQAEIQRYVGQGVDLATATRVVYAKPAKDTGAKPYQPRPFSLMREEAQERNATTRCADGSWW